jgi:hypothetical protein
MPRSSPPLSPVPLFLFLTFLIRFDVTADSDFHLLQKVKFHIEALISREYLARDEKTQGVYKYLA